jgi:hypothetical protein
MTCTQEIFLKDVATHEMHILHEDGIYRHIRFKQPNSGLMHFDLITYPGFLVYSGDMGCYVFSRLNDMFEFFRTDRQGDDKLYINLGYWAEKLQAVDGNKHDANAMEFDEDAFRRVINEYRVNWMRNSGIDKDQRRDLWEDVESAVLDRIYDGETVAYHSAYDFSHSVGSKVFQFDDLFEHNFRRYTFSFVWCCYALAWGIKKYDELKGGAT